MKTVEIAFGKNGTISGQCTGCGKTFKVCIHSDSFEFDVIQKLFPRHEGKTIILYHGDYCGCGNATIGYSFKDMSNEANNSIVRISFFGNSVKLMVERNLERYDIRLYGDDVVQHFKDLVKDLMKYKKIE